MLCWRIWRGKAQPPVAVQCQDFLLWPQGEGGRPSPAVDALGPARSQGTATTRPRVGWFRRGNYTGYAALAAYRGGRLTGFRRLAYKARCAGRISRNGVPASKRHYPAPGHCAGFSFGAVSKAVVSKPVSVESGICWTGYQATVNSAVNTKYRICRGAVTAAVTAKLHFCECFQAEVSKQVSTESGICWTGYQGMVTGMVTAEPWFSDWYARRRYATGTQQNPTKPCVRCWPRASCPNFLSPYARARDVPPLARL